MEQKYELDVDFYQTFISSSLKLREINSELEKQIEYLKNDIKPIHFKNPEKLNGRYEYNGNSYEITFIGRYLGIIEDNWTWQMRSTKSNMEYHLSILKYPQTKGYATMIKHPNWTSTNTRTEIILNSLYDKNYIVNELLSATNVPF